MIATRPLDATTWEICRLYVDPALHGQGLAPILLATAERHALTHGATALRLWSDTRFHRAHRFYAKHGYHPSAQTRALDDVAQTIERHFEKRSDLPLPPAGEEWGEGGPRDDPERR